MKSDIVQTIMDRINIVDYIGRYIQVKKVGKNFMAVCPFHNDKGPSLSISQEKGLYHCFGCGASGNIINFVMEYENLDFKEAVIKLADEANIDINFSNKYTKYSTYYKINKLAAKYYYNNLVHEENGQKALKYLKKRGVDKKIITKFGLGYAAAQWDDLYNHLRKKDVDTKTMKKLSLIKVSNSKEYDLLRDRLIFPIINRFGKVIGFGGRRLNKDDNIKYLNIAETPLFKKSGVLYGINLTKKEIFSSKELILVEGYMDMITLYQYGIRNSAAILGTAFTKEHANILNNKIDRVFLFFDSDEAGEKAVIRSLKILFDSNISSYVIVNNFNKDPDLLLKEKGIETFKKLKKNALPGFKFFLDYYKKDININNPNEKVKLYKKLKKILNDIRDEHLRYEYKKKLAESFGYKYRSNRNKSGRKNNKNINNRIYPRNEILILIFLLENKEFAEKIFDLFEEIICFVRNEKIKQELESLKNIFNKGKNLHCKGNVASYIKNENIKKNIISYLTQNKLVINEKNFNLLIEEIKRKAKIIKNRRF